MNEELGYDRANGVLVRVAGVLTDQAHGLSAIPFRAHGDEFYLVGPLTQDIGARLDDVRARIERLDVPVDGSGKQLTDTVTVGWVGVSKEATSRPSIRAQLELAVTHGKKDGRNRVVQHDSTMQAGVVIDGRSDCASCKAAFTFDVPRASWLDTDVWCPNCGTRQPR